uniref:ATP synthase F0 subunit 8 n=1 Tax=Notobitus meleagris TaxID=299284 RepID=UPI00237C3265|nr:ATP synthase F0 subunit 8 [Notobitus meleagris]WBV80530.1 ATP synthase F0 subunit 8 [Notobitus meleagris]
MPQMAPLWWEILFIMFIAMFLLTNMVIYYNKQMNPNFNIESKSYKINQFKWKW